MLSYIDDMNKVSKCGLETLANNAIITKNVEAKKLNFNVGSETKKSKCERIHVGKSLGFKLQLILAHISAVDYK